MHYNFARIHKTLRVTPATEAGVADHVWSLDEIARLAEHRNDKSPPLSPAGIAEAAGGDRRRPAAPPPGPWPVAWPDAIDVPIFIH